MANAKVNEPAPALPAAKPTSFLTVEQRDILAKSALCSRLDENQKAYFFEVVERTKLDPFTGQIRPDIRFKTEEDGTKTPTLLIIVTLQGLRVIADRTGQLDGEDAPEWCGTDGQWVDVWLADESPKAARASVYRKDRPRKQTQICRWDAFVQLKWGQNGQSIPNPFWKRMGSHMLSKCALAGAYRGAFPNQCSGLYITEELQDVLDPDSEEAVEAEMIRKARAEKAYWEGEAKKGVYPIDVQQRMQREAQQALNPNIGTATASAPPSAPPAPKPTAPPPPPPPPQNWRDFMIRRVEVFAGRTVGSLTVAEMDGLRPWLERAEKAWGALDADLKAHYMAFRERLQFEQTQQAPAVNVVEQVDFSRL